MKEDLNYTTSGLDPRVKLIASFSFLMLLTTIHDAFILFLSFIAVLCAWILAKLPVKTVVSFFKGISLLLAFMFISSTIFSRVMPKEQLMFIEIINLPVFGVIGIYEEVLLATIAFSFRTLSLVSVALLVALTTEPSKTVTVLRKLRFPYELTIMVVIAIRFIPLIVDQWKKLTAVAKVRGVETDGIRGRIKSIRKLFTPLIIHSIRRSAQLAYSLDARGFRSAKNPTTMEVLHLKRSDYLLLIFSGAQIALSVLIVLGVVSFQNFSITQWALNSIKF